MKKKKTQQFVVSKNCGYCHEGFKPKTTWQTFCSDKCRKLGFREQDVWKGTCPNCHTEITVLQANNKKEKIKGTAKARLKGRLNISE
jgi:hypothetical protein